MEAIAKKDTRRSVLRKMSLNEKFKVHNPFMQKHDVTTQIKSGIHHYMRDTRLYNQQSRCEKMNPVLNREFNGSLIFGNEPVDIEFSLRKNGDWYTELSSIADSIGMPITQIPFSQVSLLKTNWYCQLIKLVLYYEVSIWENGDPHDQFIWLQEDAVNKRAHEYLASNFKEIVLQIYEMITSEYDAMEMGIETGRQLIQSDEITFQCDFDAAQVTFSMKNWEAVKTVTSNPILTEVMEKVTSILMAYATDIIDYSVYKAVEKPM